MQILRAYQFPGGPAGLSRGSRRRSSVRRSGSGWCRMWPQTGGHLASNLGIVELQVAIEKEFDTRRDRLVFDVGHQSYVHKILTGRRDAMAGLRTLDGISGFPKPDESETDAFVAGHASNAVSVALGMARARTLQGADYECHRPTGRRRDDRWPLLRGDERLPGPARSR